MSLMNQINDLPPMTAMCTCRHTYLQHVTLTPYLDGAPTSCLAQSCQCTAFSWDLKDKKRVQSNPLSGERKIPFVLRDDMRTETITGKIIITPSAIIFQVDGYGDAYSRPGHGYVAALQRFAGQLELVYWPDINKEGNVTVSLEGAREGKQTKEES